MARSSFSTTSFPRRNYDSVKSWFIIPTSFVLVVYFYIFFYASSTLKLVIQPHHTHLFITPKLSSSFNNYTSSPVLIKPDIIQIIANEDHILHVVNNHSEALSSTVADDHGSTHHDERNVSEISGESQWSRKVQEITNASALENKSQNGDVFHDREMFVEDYKQMNTTLKIFVYPHKSKDPFANVLLPVNYEPGGNYASESYFKKALMTSHFITKNPSQAHLFFLPFSIASLRHDRRIGVGGVKDFIKNYINDISHRYPYWNRTGGADHFYVACHSIGRTAMEKATQVRDNAIQLVCSSNYFLQGYIGHKDASVPQIWPRQGEPPNKPPSKRKKLAFYAGAMNSRVRESLVKFWKDDPEISVHQNRLKTPYNESLLGSRFCIHAKGFEVNTARIGDALYYGCVPVILADHYDLPFADILNWNIFSVVVATIEIPNLKRILKAIKFDEYVELQKNVMKVRNHFQWHTIAVDYDAFYMVMYELWLRRSSVSVSFVGYQQKMIIQ